MTKIEKAVFTISDLLDFYSRIPKISNNYIVKSRHNKRLEQRLAFDTPIAKCSGVKHRLKI
jgi:hypothetical protein